jgi:murein peptide amidase A
MKLPLNDIEIIFSRIRKQLTATDFAKCLSINTPDNEYSLVEFVLGEGNQRKALISAGIHGDEPSGVETICALLENNRLKSFSDEWELTFLPCINPYGYEYGIRENQDGKDLNRLFKSMDPPVEVAFVKTILEKSYELTIELHEDFMSPGYYLYQSGTHPEDNHIGNEILQNVKSIMPINLNDEIDGRSAQLGIMVPADDYSSMDWWPMALYALSKGTRRCLTLETATSFPMNIRVEAHSIAIDTALNYFSEESNN